MALCCRNTQLRNYRHISKIPFLSKLLKNVAKQIISFMEKHDIFDEFHSGFMCASLYKKSFTQSF